MKNLIFTFVIFASFLSCSSDENSTTPNDNPQELIGVWQRADSNASIINTFEFYEDNSGIKAILEYHEDGTAISNALSIEWNANNNNLELILNEIVNTPYSFNENGQLILPAVSEFPYNRIE